MKRIVDKNFFLTEWKRSVPAMILAIVAALLDNSLVRKWVILASLIPNFGTRKELFLNKSEKIIDEALNILGIRVTLKKIPRLPLIERKRIFTGRYVLRWRWYYLFVG